MSDDPSPSPALLIICGVCVLFLLIMINIDMTHILNLSRVPMALLAVTAIAYGIYLLWKDRR